MKNFATIISILSTITLFACQKKESKMIDTNNLKLNISKPIEAQTFKKGDTVFIKANATYNEQLHGYSIKLSDKETKESYLDKEEHLHDSSFEINTFWVNTLNKKASLLLEITVEADHDGHEQTKSLSLISQP